MEISILKFENWLLFYVILCLFIFNNKKGIYIWGTPLEITNEKQEKVSLVLMDTEGLGMKQFLNLTTIFITNK